MRSGVANENVTVYIDEKLIWKIDSDREILFYNKGSAILKGMRTPDNSFNRSGNSAAFMRQAVSLLRLVAPR